MSTSDEQPLHKKEPNNSNPQDIPPKKKKCSGYVCFKLMVVIYAVFFLVVGLIVLAVGAWIESIRRDYESINDAVLSPSILAIIIGSVMIITALCGLVGALRENLVLLKIFLALVIIVFLVQVIIGIIAFVFREQTGTVAAKQLVFGIEYYNEDEGVQRAMDFVQLKFKCCGASDANDWEKNERYACSSSFNESCGLPASCCYRKRYEELGEECGNDVRKGSSAIEAIRRKRMNTKGCTFYFLAWVDQHLDVIGATALGLAIPQILGIFLIFTFIQKVEDRKFLFKYRKRAYDSS